MENNIDDGASVLVIILIYITIWIVWLYQTKNEIKEKYRQLLNFSYTFYEKVKMAKTDEDDFGDYSLSEFNEEFEEWLEENKK